MGALIRAGLKVAAVVRDPHEERDASLTEVLVSDRQVAPTTSAQEQAQVPAGVFAREREQSIGAGCTQQMRVSDSHSIGEKQTVYIYVNPQEATAMMHACRSYLDRHYETATGVAPSFRWDDSSEAKDDLYNL